MALSSYYQHFQSLRTKGNLKAPLLKRPKSIQSLKKSLSINHSNLQGFVKYIKEPTETVHVADKEDPSLAAEVNGLKNIARNIQLDLAPKPREIFMGRKNLKNKQMKRELRIQRSELKFNAQVDQQNNSLSRSFYRANASNNSKFQLTALEDKGFKNTQKITNNKKMKFRNTFSVNVFKSEVSFTYSKFWKKEGKVQNTKRRWGTQGDEKGGVEKGLGQLTDYCPKKNQKGINYLLLQLQLNLQDSKRMAKTTRNTS